MSVVPQHLPMMLGLSYTPFDQPISVLAPRSVNSQVRPRFMSDDSKQQCDRHAVPFAQRRAKQAPLSTQLQLRESRRQQHLSKVQAQRDEAQFNRRTDDILRSDFLRHKKMWESQQAQLAQLHSLEDDEELFDQVLEDETMQERAYLEECEQQDVEKQEMQEIEALLDLLSDAPLMDSSQTAMVEQEEDKRSEHFGSDDGDELEYLMDRIMDDYDDSANLQHHDEEMDLT